MSPKENVVQGSQDQSCVKLMSRKSNFRLILEILDSIVNELFFCDQ